MFNIMAGSFWLPSNIASHNFEHVRLDTRRQWSPNDYENQSNTFNIVAGSIWWNSDSNTTGQNVEHVNKLALPVLNKFGYEVKSDMFKKPAWDHLWKFEGQNVAVCFDKFFQLSQEAFKHIRIPHSHFRVSCLSKWRWIQHVEMIFEWNDLKMIFEFIYPKLVLEMLNSLS